MRSAKVLTVAICFLVAVSAANAAEYFFEDFEGDTSGWGNLDCSPGGSASNELFVVEWPDSPPLHGSSAQATRSTPLAILGTSPGDDFILGTEDDWQVTENAVTGNGMQYAATGETGYHWETNTEGPTVQWISADFSHMGGYAQAGYPGPLIPAGSGYKHLEVAFAGDDGQGISLFAAASRTEDMLDAGARFSGDAGGAGPNYSFLPPETSEAGNPARYVGPPRGTHCPRFKWPEGLIPTAWAALMPSAVSLPPTDMPGIASRLSWTGRMKFSRCILMASRLTSRLQSCLRKNGVWTSQRSSSSTASIMKR